MSTTSDPPAPPSEPVAASEPPAVTTSEPPAPLETAPPPSSELQAADTLVDDVIGYLAKQRGGVDPRYDPTLRTYARSLRRFTAYLARGASDGGAPEAPTEAVIDEYLGMR